MATRATEDELNQKHEGILGKRSVLHGQMHNLSGQQKSKKKQRAALSEAARARNALMLEDLQKIEERLKTRKLMHPDILALETKYWASVEESLPEWESFFLGKGPHPTDTTDSRTPRTPKERSSTAQDRTLPPRPKPNPKKQTERRL